MLITNTLKKSSNKYTLSIKYFFQPYLNHRQRNENVINNYQIATLHLHRAIKRCRFLFDEDFYLLCVCVYLHYHVSTRSEDYVELKHLHSCCWEKCLMRRKWKYTLETSSNLNNTSPCSHWWKQGYSIRKEAKLTLWHQKSVF